MYVDLNEITFIIVSFKSRKVIFNCIDSLPRFSNIIVIENSLDKELKRELETKYDNIEVILSDNLGMGTSNNIGIKKSNTKFVFVLNPDVILKENAISQIIENLKLIEDFSILSPINDNENFPNYRINNNYSYINENIIEVDNVDGFSMLINKSKFKNQNFFDENFFLYLENADLCLRQKKIKERIFIFKNSKIRHIGSYSTKQDLSKNLEYLRNWHWMWSKFYYNKKHYGYLTALTKTSHHLISSILKYFLYTLLFNKHRKKVYKMRFLGLFNSIIGNKSFLRPDS